MRTKTQQELIDILRYEICGTPLPAEFFVSDEDSLISVAKKHDLSHLVWDALEKNGTGCGSSYAMQQYYASIWRAEQMAHELGSMTTLFEKEGIDFMPLKGAVMRPLYPEPWMRTSADIDILFRTDDFSCACALVRAELGYVEEEEKGSHHLSFHAPASNVHVEMHQMLFADYQTDKSVTDLLSGIWDRPFPAEGYRHLMRMSDPDFYFYHIAHMAKHLISDGGCPVRSLIDLHILDRHPMRDEPGRRELLEKAGLQTFADMMSATAKAWLDGGMVPSEELEQFILTGNMYGTGKNRVAMDVETNGLGGYVLRRIFLPYDNLKYLFPVLQEHKWLTPLFQVVRWTRVFSRKYRSRLKKQTEALLQADKKETDQLVYVSHLLGIEETKETSDV